MLKLLSYSGILAAIACIGLAFVLSQQYCYGSSCECDLELANLDFFSVSGISLGAFFLFYSILHAFRLSEKKVVRQQQKNEGELLDDEIMPLSNFTIYQLPWVKSLAWAGLGLSILLLLYAYFVSNNTCVAIHNCDMGICGRTFYFDQEIYMIGFGTIAVFFIMFTTIGLLKSYPAKI